MQIFGYTVYMIINNTFLIAIVVIDWLYFCVIVVFKMIMMIMVMMIMETAVTITIIDI